MAFLSDARVDHAAGSRVSLVERRGGAEEAGHALARLGGRARRDSARPVFRASLLFVFVAMVGRIVVGQDVLRDPEAVAPRDLEDTVGRLRYALAMNQVQRASDH